VPDILRIPYRLDCAGGIDLVSPIDRQPPGCFPFYSNIRVVSEGRIEARQGYTRYTPASIGAVNIHSFRRLNDATGYYVPSYTYLAGVGSQLWIGPETALNLLDTGYSGNPLSLLPFRPENSPVAWMYVYDVNKQEKVRPDGVVRPIGTAPPTGAPATEYGVPAMVTITDGDDVTGWVAWGSASAIGVLGDRTNAAAPSTYSVLYNSGSSGWACMRPNPGAGSFFWASPRMRITLDPGGGNEEKDVLVREIHPAIPATTISAIAYDSGATGMCSVVLANPSADLARNSLLLFDSTELVRVLAVVLSPDGLTYSVRCSTTNTFTAGVAVTGMVSWYIYTLQAHGSGETISLNYVPVTQIVQGKGYASKLVTVDASKAGGRPVSISDDYLHFSIFLQNPQFVTSIELKIDIDSSTSTVGAVGDAFTRNYFTWTITPDQLNQFGPTVGGGGSGSATLSSDQRAAIEQTIASLEQKLVAAQNGTGDFAGIPDVARTSVVQSIQSQISYLQGQLSQTPAGTGGSGASATPPYTMVGDSWTDMVIPLASMVRSGHDQTRTLADIKAIEVMVESSDACSWGFDCWYLFGTYGPVVQSNSPTGIYYLSRDRDSTAGSPSIPGPQTRYGLFPLREAILVTPQTTAASGVDSLDIYRLGGSFDAFTYVGTVENNVGSPKSFTDTQPDTVLSANESPDPTLIQPWPVLDLPWAGTVNVVGTSVTQVGGDAFKTALLPNTVILINGTAYQLYGQPSSTTKLEISASAGVQTGVAYKVASPMLAGQPMPFAFGPLEGPFAPVIFGLGDPLNAGSLYYTNPSNADACASANKMEVCSPSEPLVSGAAWNSLAIVGSRDNVFVVRYSFLQTLETTGNVIFQFSRIPADSGMWCRWACCRGPDGIYYLGRDGLYRATEQGAENVTDVRIYPLFPHAGQPAAGANGLLPVDMSKTTELRLSAGDQSIYFDYTDTGGAARTLRYEVPKKRWFPHTYGDSISTHYMDELPAASASPMQLLLLSRALGLVYVSGGDTDSGVAISSVLQLPTLDGGDQRGQKLFVDQMLDADGTGTFTALIEYNNQTVNGPTLAASCSGVRAQFLTNIDSLADLSLYRNISTRFTWTGGPSGPRFYGVEPSGYVQPYLSTFLVTQFLSLGYTGWKHHRRIYAGLISTSDVLFTIKTQDGRTFGPYTIPSTAGQFRVFPLIVDHGCKDLAFAYQLDGQGHTFALFPEAFTLETKAWSEPSYIPLAVLKT